MHILLLWLDCIKILLPSARWYFKESSHIMVQNLQIRRKSKINYLFFYVLYYLTSYHAHFSINVLQATIAAQTGLSIENQHAFMLKQEFKPSAFRTVNELPSLSVWPFNFGSYNFKAVFEIII